MLLDMKLLLVVRLYVNIACSFMLSFIFCVYEICLFAHYIVIIISIDALRFILFIGIRLEKSFRLFDR